MSQITIFFLYIIAGLLFARSRLFQSSQQAKTALAIASICAAAGIGLHALVLSRQISYGDSLVLSIGNVVSFIGLQLALIAGLGSLKPEQRGLAGSLFLLAALASVASGYPEGSVAQGPMSWQIQAHVLISLFAYGLLTVGTIVAIFSLVQERRLRSRKLSVVNQLFAPLETTEKLLFGIAGAGFLILLLAVVSGFAFVENLFAQHLVHKTALSILALVMFGILLFGRMFAGWRGQRAVYLYLWGFGVLCLAYFGSRFVLENILGRSWS